MHLHCLLCPVLCALRLFYSGATPESDALIIS